MDRCIADEKSTRGADLERRTLLKAACLGVAAAGMLPPRMASLVSADTRNVAPLPAVGRSGSRSLTSRSPCLVSSS
jgi:hypothetical protein